MAETIGGQRTVITDAQLKEWRRLAQNTTMVSAVGEYTPTEFIDLLDEVERLRSRGGGEWTALREARDRAYCDYVDQLRRPECLGYEQKLKEGSFGKAELDAHTRAGELLGRHRAFAEALAAAAPAPPAKWTCGNSDHACNLRGYCVNTNCSEFSGPPRGGSSSDLAEPSNLKVGDEVWVRATVTRFIERENNGVEIRLEFRENGMIRTWCNASDLRSLPEAVAGNASAPVGEPSATVVSANESAVIPLDKLSEEWDRLDRYYSQLADVAAGAGYDKGSFIGKSIGFSVCAAQLRAALPASSGMGSGQLSGVGEPRKHVVRDFVYEIEQESDGRWLAEITSVPGCLAYGPTSDVAIAKCASLAYQRLGMVYDPLSPSNTLVAKEAHTELVQKEVGEGLREAECRYCLGTEHPSGTMCSLHPDLIRPEKMTVSTKYIVKLLNLAAGRAALAAPAPKPAPHQPQGGPHDS